MGIVDNFKYFFNRNQFWRHWISGTRKTHHYRRIDENEIIEAYNGNDAIYSIVNYIARNGSTIPTTYLKNDVEIENENDPYVQLMENPSANVARWDFLYRAFLYLSTTGDLIIRKYSESIGFDKQLLVLPSNYVEVQKKNINKWDSPIECYKYSNGATTETIDPSEIIHLKYYDPDCERNNWDKGLSPLQAGNWLLQANNNLTVGESQILENGGASSVISAKDSTTGLLKKDQDLLDEAFVQRTGGADKLGKSIRLNSAVDVQQIGANTRDLQLIEMYPTHLKRLCTLFNLPAELFNAQGSGQFNTRKEARKAAFGESIIPMAEMIFASIDKGIKDWGFEGYSSVVNKDKIDALNPDRQEQQDSVVNLFEKGLISRDKALEMLGIDDGGEIEKESEETSKKETE